MRTNALGWFSGVVGLSAPFHGGQIERCGPASAQGHVVGVRRMGTRGPIGWLAAAVEVAPAEAGAPIVRNGAGD
ncbi:unnamed protein product [Penicillium roqueforti FM164]|uniref:Genomic scaffold, ProqFM164S01 n=1 Tax=Penicillium roqueforti (strain FM164) TaxID=1365484 RepID=W6Q115_PENRF|nr:unnamed protein product [Penicillium roqueforti FM164]